MNEKTWKAFIKLMKDAHDMEESEVLRYLGDDTLLAEKVTEIKDGLTNSFKDGISDGMKKAKSLVLNSLKKELELDLGQVDKIENIGSILAPKLVEKYKADPNTTPANESDVIKKLKLDYEKKITDLGKEKDEAVKLAESKAETTVHDIRRESIAQKVLKDEGYAIPEDKSTAETKFDLAKYFLEKKGFTYEFDTKENKYFRVDDGGVRVRGKSNKPLTYEDDVKEVFEVSHGRNPANPKGSTGLPKNGEGNQGGTGAFDFSKLTNKTVTPTNVEEGLKHLNNPTISLDDRKIIREYVETEQAKTADATV